MGAYDDLIPGGPQTPTQSPETQPSPSRATGYSDLVPQDNTPGAMVPSQDVSAYSDLVPDVNPALGGYPAVSNYITEGGKAIVRGLTETFATEARGLAASRVIQAQQQLEALNQPKTTPDDTSYVTDPFERAAIVGRRRGPRPLTPEAEAERRSVLEPIAQQDVRQHPAYRAGEYISQNLSPQSQKILNPVVEDVLQGVGSLGANIGQAFVPVVGPAVLTAGAIFQGQGEAVERALKAGATQEQALRAAAMGTLPGLTEFADALIVTAGSPGRATGLMWRVGRKALEGAFIEGGQEGLQQFMQNAIAKGVYKPLQDIFEDVLYNTFIGGIVGGVARPVLERSEPTTAPTQQQVNQAFTGLTGQQTVAPTPPSQPPPSAVPASPSGGIPSNLSPEGPSGQPPFAPPSATRIEGAIPPEPPPNIPPEMGTLAAGQGREDLGFGVSIETRPNDFVLVDSDGRVLASNTDIDALRTLGNRYLEEGDSVLPTKGVEDTSATPSEPEGGSNTYVDTRTNQRLSLNEAMQTSIAYLKSQGIPLRNQIRGGGPIEIINAAIEAGLPLQPGTLKAAIPPGNVDTLVPRPRLTSVDPNTVDPKVIDFLTRRKAKITAAEEEPPPNMTPPGDDTDPNAPAKQELRGKAGANIGRMAKLLGPKLYGTPEDIAPVTIKELMQNSFDAIKAMIESKVIDKGKIDILMDSKTRTISVVDNGAGMAPEILATKFLEIAGTEKTTERATGGFGIAKMLFLFGNQSLDVITMRNNQVARMSTTGPKLLEAMENPEAQPKISVNPPTWAERELFPFGHGTAIRVKVPEKFIDPSDGTEKQIAFDTYEPSHPVVRNSPLFDNIDVTFNGRNLPIGSKFPYQDYTQYADVKFNWGTARIYVSKESNVSYGRNMHVLGNGLWQFSGALRKDPLKTWGDIIPYTFYVDVSPKVKPEDAGYPFDLNRQGFAASAKEDFGNIFTFISKTYQFENFKDNVTNYGDMVYLEPFLPEAGKAVKIERSPKLNLEFKRPAADTPISKIRPGDTVEVVDGKMKVNGRDAPILTPEQLEATKFDVDNLIVDQSQIDANRVMLHDNTLVTVSAVEIKPITQLGEEKFGARFDEFMWEVGDLFRELRDVVADVMGYEELKKEAIGISFDTEYRGVSIRVPFAGSFINPALPEYNDPVRAGVGVAGTMVHELAHHKVRSHDANFPAEMQRILINLDAHTEFDFHDFKQRVVDAYARYQDVFNYINSLYSGAFGVGPRGSRFTESGDERVGDGRTLESVAPTGGAAERVEGVPTGTRQGQAVPPTRGPAPEPALTTRERGTVGGLREQLKNSTVLRSTSRDSGLDAPPPASELEPQKMAVAAASVPPGTTTPRGTGGGPGSPVPPAVSASGIHADRMNWLYKWAYGLDRLVDANPRFTPLLRYAERVREMRLDTARVHDAALRIAKAWRHLGGQTENLAAFIDDISNMVYRTPAEVSRGVARHPTAAEFAALVARHGVSAAALRVFDRQKKFFELFLGLVTQNAREHAMRTIVSNPVMLADKLNAINTKEQNLLSRPYFPFLRFGLHYVEVRNAAGKVVHFETFERQGLRSAESQQMRRKKQLQRAAAPGDVVTNGVLPETVAPFIGLPPELLEAVQRELALTPAQRDAMEQLRFELSPAASFAHRFQHKNYVPGYSHDFLRSFSRYAFHGARYYARTKYAWALQQEIANAGRIPGNKEGAVANYMRDHFTNTVLDSKGDFGLFKGAIFLWVFGYSVAGAFVNLSQVPMISFPWMAAKFGGIGKGDALVTKQLAFEMANFTNFYRKGKYDTTPGVPASFETKAIEYGIKSGRISEAFAAELAGLAQGNNLLGMGNSKAGRGFQMFMEKASWMFEMAEQFNRRVTYSAALKLAMKYPTSLAVREALNKYADEYTKLQASGFSQVEASAIVTAVHATEQTQFVYSRDTRPRIFKGRLAGTIFVFKTYMLNVLQLLGANKASVLPRYLIVMLALSGLMGLPGADDMADIANELGKWWFGKDFDLKLAIREFILDHAGDKIPPDVVLHGLARRGFGVPAILDLMGEKPGRGLRPVPAQNVPAPVVDMSRSVGMGRVLPFDLGKVLDPGKDVNAAIAGTAQQASGAVFSVGFNLYKALQDSKTPTNDWKRWERAMPRALASASRGYRAFSEGRERGRGGPNSASTIVNYDRRDTEQMAEIVALTLGFMPLRQSGKWDEVIAQSNVVNKFKFEREILLNQFFEARFGSNQEEIANVRRGINDYNKNLPTWARGMAITPDTIQQSVQVRARNKAAQESGVPQQLTQVPIARHIQSLFPESVVDVRKVPKR